MTVRSLIVKIVQREDLNFLLTNRMPRRLLSRFMGWFSQIEQPLIRDLSLAVWRCFSDLDLSDASETHFRSMHHCFTRRLKGGARPIDTDPKVLVSPCDAIIGASGMVADGQVFQVKGFPYALEDLFGDSNDVATFCRGRYVTLRLTSSMYHRFHAPHDCRVNSVTTVSGDTWNVNPIALQRVERLFCKNQRALIRTRLCLGDYAVTLVPVAAILVSGIRLPFLQPSFEDNTDTRDRQGRVGSGPDKAGRRTFPCDASFYKGEEMGWFEHGSTIIVFAPEGFTLCDGLDTGMTIRVGQKLMRMPL